MAGELIVNLLSTMTLFGHIFLAVSLVYMIIKHKVSVPFVNIIRHNRLKFAFLIALFSMLGSLFFSEIMHWEPCRLCWYQRILMYPLVLILGIAIIKKDKKVNIYALPMSILGILFAAYHYYIQVSNTATACSATEVSCNVTYMLGFGYISIPLMAATAFAMIIALLTIYAHE